VLLSIVHWGEFAVLEDMGGDCRKFRKYGFVLKTPTQPFVFNVSIVELQHTPHGVFNVDVYRDVLSLRCAACYSAEVFEWVVKLIAIINWVEARSSAEFSRRNSRGKTADVDTKT
jgi:hypothetical protein